MEVRNASCTLDRFGLPQGKKVLKTVREYKDTAYLYENPRTDNPLVYEVYTFTEAEDQKAGSLCWGLTVLKPVYSAGECNMTKGHFHRNRECAEFYLCTKGQGLLLLMDESGKTWAEEMKPGSLHYIRGNHAHRSINTGNEDLWISACWPSDAGHDYAAVEEREFRYRVKKHGDEIIFEERDI